MSPGGTCGTIIVAKHLAFTQILSLGHLYFFVCVREHEDRYLTVDEFLETAKYGVKYGNKRSVQVFVE